MRDLSRPDHLPNLREGRQPREPSWLPRQRRGVTPQMIGRYPDYDVFDASNTWDAATAKVIADRMEIGGHFSFFVARRAADASRVVRRRGRPGQRATYPSPRARRREARRGAPRRLPVRRHARRSRDLADHARRPRRGSRLTRHDSRFADLGLSNQESIVEAFSKGWLTSASFDRLNVSRAWAVCMRMILAAFYSHPWAWNEIGFGGPAYPRGFMRLGPTSTREPFEKPGATDEDPVRIVAEGDSVIRHFLKGSIGPKDNDSRYLLDVHRRDLPGEETMRRYRDNEEVDLCVVGAGAGGSVLAQRLARKGWKVVIIEAGPFWHPDEDWVSDEAGSHELYWNEKRIIGGTDPIEMGKNNSGRGVGGSMVHYAGYCPRFHPSDLQTMTLDGVGADWPITYEDLRPHYERVEAELPVAGQNWPWGYPHTLSALAAPDLRGSVGALARRDQTGHHDARRPSRHCERHLR